MGAQEGEENKNKGGQKAFGEFTRKKTTFTEEVERCMWLLHVITQKFPLSKKKKKPGNWVTHFKLLITFSHNNHTIFEQQGESRMQH